MHGSTAPDAYLQGSYSAALVSHGHLMSAIFGFSSAKSSTVIPLMFFSAKQVVYVWIWRFLPVPVNVVTQKRLKGIRHELTPTLIVLVILELTRALNDCTKSEQNKSLSMRRLTLAIKNTWSC